MVGCIIETLKYPCEKQTQFSFDSTATVVVPRGGLESVT